MATAYEDFAALVSAAGLQAKACREDHWQILGGVHLVNFWPYTKDGQKYHVAGTSCGRIGDLRSAIDAALGGVPIGMRTAVDPGKGYRKSLKRDLHKADPHCYLCRAPVTLQAATIEHRIPLGKGGTWGRDNTFLACGKCNKEKADKMPTEAANRPYVDRVKELARKATESQRQSSNFEAMNELSEEFDKQAKKAAEARASAHAANGHVEQQPKPDPPVPAKLTCSECCRDLGSNFTCNACREYLNRSFGFKLPKVKRDEDYRINDRLELMEHAAALGFADKIVVYVPRPEQSLNYTIAIGDRFVDELCWDEMLGVFVRMTTPTVREIPYGILRTEAQYQEQRRGERERSAKRRAENAAEERQRLSTPDRQRIINALSELTIVDLERLQLAVNCLCWSDETHAAAREALDRLRPVWDMEVSTVPTGA